jgi:hypothetical protein
MVVALFCVSIRDTVKKAEAPPAVTDTDPNFSRPPGPNQQQFNPNPPRFNPNPPPQFNQPPFNPPRPNPAMPLPAPGPGPATNPKRPFDVDPQAKAAGQTVYLSVFTPFDPQNGFTTDLGPLTLQGRPIKYGIRMHPALKGSCGASYAPGQQFKKFKGWAGLGDWDPNPRGAVIFTVSGDGRRLWDSPPIAAAGSVVKFDIDVSNVDVLTLATRFQVEGTYSHAEAAWFDSWLER